MEMLAHNPGKMKNKPKGLSSEKAAEYVSHNTGSESYSHLPESHNEPKKKRKYKALGKY